MEFKYTFHTHRLNSMLLGQDYAGFGSTGLSGPASREIRELVNYVKG
ncbi:TPA: hypothetical protein HA338_11190 [Methanosarcina acetivorans]|uniref:Uncharacterized protein n=1 Tax=Methanosarcina acetivorans TaxID=2214 RepID=A0A832SHS6_9EURY|nr:hypothetical protein [Methanosarcina acetivorans]HIH94554.1 hypothetical protein [Methanosarcina acetivorans]